MKLLNLLTKILFFIFILTILQGCFLIQRHILPTDPKGRECAKRADNDRKSCIRNATVRWRECCRQQKIYDEKNFQIAFQNWQREYEMGITRYNKDMEEYKRAKALYDACYARNHRKEKQYWEKYSWTMPESMYEYCIWVDEPIKWEYIPDKPIRKDFENYDFCNSGCSGEKYDCREDFDAIFTQKCGGKIKRGLSLGGKNPFFSNK